MPPIILTTPGTVSRILWHFTGGPDWNSKTQKQMRRPKARDSAYANLVSVVKTLKLRLGGYSESISVSVPGRRIDSMRIQSSPVCCLTDIPVQHLSYHSGRYGKFAIGFHREAVVRHGFNPVLYSLEDWAILHGIYSSLTSLRRIDTGEVVRSADSIITTADEVENDELDCVADDIQHEALDITVEADLINSDRSKAMKGFQDLLAFVKTFKEPEFDSIYCEREWRSIRPFRFRTQDIAMIVLPRNVARKNYFAAFCKISGTRLKLPRTVPILPWEDLVEH